MEGQPTLDQIIEYTNNDALVHYASMANRVGLNGWMTQVEYTYFKPDTPMQEQFSMFIMKWPDDLAMYWVIASFPIEFEKRATDLLWQHGLKVAGADDPDPTRYTFMVLGGPLGQQNFPLRGRTVRCLENHSKGAQNVAYTNDPVKLEAARRHEEEVIIGKYHKEHAAWLATPEGRAAAEAYWVSMSPKDQEHAYFEQIRLLSLAARMWMGQNPKIVADLRFRGKQEVMVIGTVPDAIKAKALEVNEGGLALLTAMGAMTEGPGMPTVFMVRMALEHMDSPVGLLDQLLEFLPGLEGGPHG